VPTRPARDFWDILITTIQSVLAPFTRVKSLVYK
jgi:hypothetical protein